MLNNQVLEILKLNTNKKIISEIMNLHTFKKYILGTEARVLFARSSSKFDGENSEERPPSAIQRDLPRRGQKEEVDLRK